MSNPNVYLFRLLANTAIVGLLTLLLNWIYIHSTLYEFKIPTAMHSTIIVAISFVLAFRANTAYAGWSEGKKNIIAMASAANMFSIKIRVCSESIKANDRAEIKKMLIKFLDNFQNYLKTDKESECQNLKEAQDEAVYSVLSKLKSLEMTGAINPQDLAMLEKFFTELVSAATTCHRIKDTPIPTNYAMHIKVSIFVFILSLPFGIFYDMQLWSSLVVMVIFYILYGIELISAEIENPFYGDPNDIPLDEFIEKMTKTIDRNLK